MTNLLQLHRVEKELSQTRVESDIYKLTNTSSKAVNAVIDWESISSWKLDTLIFDSQEAKLPFGFGFREFYENVMYIFSWYQSYYSQETRDDMLMIGNLWIAISKLHSQIPILFPSQKSALQHFWEQSDEYLSILKLRAWFDRLETLISNLEDKINKLLLSKIIWDYPRMPEYNFWKEFEWIEKDIQALEVVVDALKKEYDMLVIWILLP